jgi:hypothetical protein
MVISVTSESELQLFELRNIPEEPLATTTALVQLEILHLSRKATRTGLFPELRDKILLSKTGTPMGLILILRLSTFKARAALMVARKAKVLCRA